jgi:nucleoside-diphosphate-sugar epimerase/predicted dehydrogenase
MRVAIVGAGHIAGVHGHHILRQRDAEVVGIVDKDVAKADILASRLGIKTKLYDDMEKMIHEQKPNVVHVLSPPQYHAPLSIMALIHGSHVFVEKPMALTIEDAVAMIETAERNGVQLCVDHNMVFEDLVQQAIRLVRQGVIGDPVSVEVSLRFDPRRYPEILEEGAEYWHWTYQLNGGPLQDLMPHPASVIFEFIQEIKEIQFVEQDRGLLPNGWSDEIRVLIKSDRLLGYISVSLHEKPDTTLLVIRGKRGTVEVDLFVHSLIIRTRSRLPRAIARALSGFQLGFQNVKGSVTNAYKLSAGRLTKSGGIGPIISAFYDAIREGSNPPVPLVKSRQVVELLSRIWPNPVKSKKKASRLHAVSTSKRTSDIAFVTGATGFVGTHLVRRLLSEGKSVRALVRPNSLHRGRFGGTDVEIVEGDLRDRETLHEAAKGARTIYHLGAAVGGGWKEHEQVTVEGTKMLIEAALVCNVERFVHISTLDIYEHEENAIITEDSPYRKTPEHPYSYSKIQAEKLALDAWSQKGLRVTIIRPGLVIGPLGRIFFPHLGFRYQDWLFLLIGADDTSFLPLTYVDNTVDAILKASANEQSLGRSYNIIDDGQVTARAYLEAYTKVTGQNIHLIRLPYLLPYLATTAYEIGAAVGVLKKGMTSRAQLKRKHTAVRFDNSRAKTELGWSPIISVEEGLQRTFRWYANRYL